MLEDVDAQYDEVNGDGSGGSVELDGDEEDVLSIVINNFNPEDNDAAGDGDIFIGTAGKGVFVSRNDGTKWWDYNGSGSTELGNKIVRSLEVIEGGPAWLKKDYIASHLISVGRSAPQVSDLARRLAVSRRHLCDQFNACLGVSPKRFGQMVRVRGIIRYLARRPQTSLTSVAHDFGYYDVLSDDGVSYGDYVEQLKRLKCWSPPLYIKVAVPSSAREVSSWQVCDLSGSSVY